MGGRARGEVPRIAGDSVLAWRRPNPSTGQRCRLTGGRCVRGSASFGRRYGQRLSRPVDLDMDLAVAEFGRPRSGEHDDDGAAAAAGVTKPCRAVRPAACGWAVRLGGAARACGRGVRLAAVQPDAVTAELVSRATADAS